MEVYFSRKILEIRDPEKLTEKSTEAIEGAAKFFTNIGIQPSKIAQEGVKSVLEVDKYESLKKFLETDSVDIKISEDKNQNKRQDNRPKKQIKTVWKIEDCDAFGAYDLVKDIKDALKKKNPGHFYDCLFAVLDCFPFVSKIVQSKFVKVIETASKKYNISKEILTIGDRIALNNYTVVLEFMISLYNSKPLEDIYKRVKGKKSPFDLKQSRESLVSDIIFYQRTKEEEPVHVYHGQKIASILLDITHTFGYTNAKEVTKETEKFWNIITKGNIKKIANAFENLVEFLNTAKIKLFEKDLSYLKTAFWDGFVKEKFLKIPEKEEKVEISEESKYELPLTNQQILEKIEGKLDQVKR